MILDRKIKWKDRVAEREALKRRGFVSQHTIARQATAKGTYVDFKKWRKELGYTTEVQVIRLNTSGAITYWYRDTFVKKKEQEMPAKKKRRHWKTFVKNCPDRIPCDCGHEMLCYHKDGDMDTCDPNDKFRKDDCPEWNKGKKDK